MSYEDGDGVVDLYDDLPEFNMEATIQKLEAENKTLSQKVKELSARVAELETDNNVLNRMNKNLKANISSLIRTVQEEVQRKDNTIAELRQEREDLFFRRKKPNKRDNGAQSSDRKRDTGQHIEENENSDPRRKLNDEISKSKRSTRQSVLSSENNIANALTAKKTKDKTLPKGRTKSPDNNSVPFPKSSSSVPEPDIQTQSKSSRSSTSRKASQDKGEYAKNPLVYRLIPLPMNKDPDDDFQGKRPRRPVSSSSDQSTKLGALDRTEVASVSSVMSDKLRKTLNGDIVEGGPEKASGEVNEPTTPQDIQAKGDTLAQSSSTSPKKRLRKTPTSRLYVKTRSSPRLSAKLQNLHQETSSDVSLLEALQLEEKIKAVFPSSPMLEELSPLQDNEKSLSPLPLLPRLSSGPSLISPLVSPVAVRSSSPVSSINSLLTGVLKFNQSPNSSNVYGPRAQLQEPLPEMIVEPTMPHGITNLSAPSSDRARKETSGEKESSCVGSTPGRGNISRKEGVLIGKDILRKENTIPSRADIQLNERISRKGENKDKEETSDKDGISRRAERKRDDEASRREEKKRRDEEMSQRKEKRCNEDISRREEQKRKEEMSWKEEKKRRDEEMSQREEKRRNEEISRREEQKRKEEISRRGERMREEEMSRKEEKRRDEMSRREEHKRKDEISRREERMHEEEMSGKEEKRRDEDMSRREERMQEEEKRRDEDMSRREERMQEEEKRRDEDMSRREERMQEEEKKRDDDMSRREELMQEEEKRRDEDMSRREERMQEEEKRRGEEMSRREEQKRKEEIARREERVRDEISQREEKRRIGEIFRREERTREEEMSRIGDKKCEEETTRGTVCVEEVRQKEETKRKEEECRKEETGSNGETLRKVDVSRNEEATRNEETKRKEEIFYSVEIPGKREQIGVSSNKIIKSSVPEIENDCLSLKSVSETRRQDKVHCESNKRHSDPSALQCDFERRRRIRVVVQMIVKTPPCTPNNKSENDEMNKVTFRSPQVTPSNQTVNMISKEGMTSANHRGEKIANAIPTQKPVIQTINKAVENSVPQTTSESKVRDKYPRECDFKKALHEVAHTDTAKHFNIGNKRPAKTANGIRRRSRSRSRSPPRSNMRENLPPIRQDHFQNRHAKTFRSPPPRHRYSRRGVRRVNGFNFSRRSRSLSPRFHSQRRNLEREERFPFTKLPSDKKEREMMLFGKSPDRKSPIQRRVPQRPVVVTMNVRRKKKVQLEDEESKVLSPQPKPASLSSTSRLVHTPVDFRERYAEVFSNTGESDSESGAFSSESESLRSNDSDDSYRPKKRKRVRAHKKKTSKKLRTDDDQ